MEPTTYGLIALAVLALLCGMRRRRTGDGVDRSDGIDGGADEERKNEARRAADAAFVQFENHGHE